MLSFDEGKKAKSYKKVTETFVRTTGLIYTLSFVNGEKLETTWNHPFYIVKKSRQDKTELPQLGVSLISARFIDSDSFSGENNSSLDGEWVSAKDLKAGDVSLIASGKRLLISSIVTSYKSETVYNFSVADNHTYFVGVDGVLVHNSEKYTQERYDNGIENLPHSYIRLSNGEILDVSHIKQFREIGEKIIADLEAAIQSGDSKPNLVMRAGLGDQKVGLGAEIFTTVDVDLKAWGLTKNSSIDSPEFRNLVRSLSMLHNFNIEHNEGGMPGGGGSYFREEDLKSGFVGTEMALQKRKAGVSWAKAEESVLKNLGASELLTNSEFATKKKSLQFIPTAASNSNYDGFQFSQNLGGSMLHAVSNERSPIPGTSNFKSNANVLWNGNVRVGWNPVFDTVVRTWNKVRTLFARPEETRKNEEK